MPKVLVDRLGGVIASTHEHPLNFSISGKYIIDLQPGLAIIPQTNVVADLLTSKISAYMAEHPSLTTDESDELITAPNIDAAESDRYLTGTKKRTAIFPGGSIVTNPIAVAGTTSSIFVHWYRFTVYTDPGLVSVRPEPMKVLYNYNPATSNFEEFTPATFTVDVRDSPNTATLLALSPDVEQAFVFGPGSFRLRFTNTSSSRIFHLSDWIILHDG